MHQATWWHIWLDSRGWQSSGLGQIWWSTFVFCQTAGILIHFYHYLTLLQILLKCLRLNLCGYFPFGPTLCSSLQHDYHWLVVERPKWGFPYHLCCTNKGVSVELSRQKSAVARFAVHEMQSSDGIKAAQYHIFSQTSIKLSSLGSFSRFLRSKQSNSTFWKIPPILSLTWLTVGVFTLS